MKKSLVALATLAAFVSANAFAAGEVDPQGQFATQVHSPLTRAEVHAEAVAAIAAGKLRPSNPHLSASVQPAMNTSTTRADVVADFLNHREEAAAFTGEDSGSAYLARLAPARAGREYLARAR